MTSARATKIDLNATPFYHCMSRCVRRSFLCGIDTQTGVDYSHRKNMLVARMKKLASIFAIQICAYAVMNNHYHLVLFVDEDQANSWNDGEVKSRWAALHPHDANKYALLDSKSTNAQEKLCEWRARLVDISWFMKSLNETMAKICNKEDDCKGHFWEARFKSQALLDEAAVIAAMAYVDLNPIRAKIATTPETSEFTSIFDRIKNLNKSTKSNAQVSDDKISEKIDKALQPHHLMPIKEMNQDAILSINLKLSDYVTLVDTTGRLLREDKPGFIPDNLPPILHRLKLSNNGWLSMVQNLEHQFFVGIGDCNALCEFRSQYRKHNPKGLIAAKQCYSQAA